MVPMPPPPFMICRHRIVVASGMVTSLGANVVSITPVSVPLTVSVPDTGTGDGLGEGEGVGEGDMVGELLPPPHPVKVNNKSSTIVTIFIFIVPPSYLFFVFFQCDFDHNRQSGYKLVTKLLKSTY